ncbi:putative ArCR [uncultured archaeon]|nr:putative ArCR [uncultured archaeon]
MLRFIPGLMDKGSPVSLLFTKEKGEASSLLFCELIQKARYGESFLARAQGCKVGAYVLGETMTSPEDYYFDSGRYKNRQAAKRAVSSLHRLENRKSSIKIAPYSGGDFDILILFLKPERAMRLIQAYSWARGELVEIRTGGIASVCGDCTAYTMKGMMGISLGCKGSRKHTGYADEEVVVGIPFGIAGEIEEALGKIPGTFE